MFGLLLAHSRKVGGETRNWYAAITIIVINCNCTISLLTWRMGGVVVLAVRHSLYMKHWWMFQWGIGPSYWLRPLDSPLVSPLLLFLILLLIERETKKKKTGWIGWVLQQQKRKTPQILSLLLSLCLHLALSCLYLSSPAFNLITWRKKNVSACFKSKTLEHRRDRAPDAAAETIPL